LIAAQYRRSDKGATYFSSGMERAGSDARSLFFLFFAEANPDITGQKPR